MASMLIILLASVIALAASAPVALDDVTTTKSAVDDKTEDGVEFVEIIGIVAVPVELETTTEAAGEEKGEGKEEKHAIAKRSPLTVDNSNTDLLAGDAVKNDDGESSLIGHKIKFLPSWAG